MSLVLFLNNELTFKLLSSISGVTRSYTQTFRSIRNNRLERYAAETNKLLIRLDKLLVNLPADPVKRKGKNIKKICDLQH